MAARVLWALILSAVVLPARGQAQSEPPPSLGEASFEELDALSLADLLNMKVVTTSKKEEFLFEAPGVVQVITAADIKAFGAIDLWDVLERVTGLVRRNDVVLPRNGLGLRGDATGPLVNHVLVLIDGRPFRESTTGGVHFDLFTSFPLPMVERIEIVRGPGSVLYGTNAYTGVINVIVKRAQRFQAEAGFQFGTFRTIQGNLAAGTSWKDLQVFAAARILNTQGWNWTHSDPAGVTDTFSNSSRGVGVSLGAHFKGLSLNAFFATGSRPALLTDYFPSVDMSSRRLFVDLGYTLSLGTQWTLSANVTHNNAWIEGPIQPIPPSFEGNNPLLTQRAQDVLGELTLSGDLLQGLRVLIGGVANYQQGGYANAEAAPPVGQGTRIETSGIRPYGGISWSGYGQLEYRPVSFLKLVVGGQGYKPNGVDPAFVPRVASILHFTEALGLKLLYGEAFRAGYAFETHTELPDFGFFGNPALRPERVATLDVQVFYGIERLQVSATYFHSHQNNLIGNTFDPTTGQITYQNLGTWTFQGAEIETKYIPTKSIHLMGGYSFQFNEDGSGRANATAIPSHSLKVGAAYHSDVGITIGVFNSFYSASHPTLSTDPAIPAPSPAPATDLLSANISLDLVRLYGWKIPFGILLDLYANNLLGTPIQVPMVTSLPNQPGMSWYGQLRVQH